MISNDFGFLINSPFYVLLFMIFIIIGGSYVQDITRIKSITLS